MPDWLIAVLWFFCGFAVGFLPSVWVTIERAFRLADMRRKFERAEAGRDAILNILDKLIDSAEYESCDRILPPGSIPTGRYRKRT